MFHIGKVIVYDCSGHCYDTMAGKTPVTILNEMMLKIKSTVLYEYCSSESNPNSHVFTCKVICDGVTAIGSGHSKKDAKQNAAQTMLEKIGKRTAIIQPSVNVSDVTIVDSAMQELKKLCSKYQFEEPTFEDLDVTGPPHARNFSVQCTVSTLTEVGTATTKKQAKICAANKMIKKLQDTFSVDNFLHKEPRATKTTKKIDKNGDGGNNILKSMHKKSTTGKSAKLKINYSFKSSSERTELVEKAHDLASDLLPKVEYLQGLVQECQRDINEKNVKKVKEEFQVTLESVNIDFHHMLLQTEGPKTYMLIIQLNTIPDILEMSLGATREEAELRTINKVIESLRVLLN